MQVVQESMTRDGLELSILMDRFPLHKIRHEGIDWQFAWVDTIWKRLPIPFVDWYKPIRIAVYRPASYAAPLIESAEYPRLAST